MYQNNQQQSQLPFPADRPLYPQQQIDVNRPAFVPQVPVANWLQPYLPYLTGVMMDVITRNSPQGPISMFFYNQMSSNNWANQDFVSLVHSCADLMFLENQNYIPTQNDIGNIVGRTVQSFLEMASVYAIKQFPALWGYIAEPDKRNMQQAHYAFEQMMQNIQQMRQATPAPMNVGQQVGMPGYGAPPQHQAYMNPGQPQQQQYPQHQAMMGRPMAGMGAPGGGRSYDAAPSQVQQAPPPQMAPVHQQQAPVQPMKGQAMSPPNTQADNLVDPDNFSWKAPSDVPYPPAYNPITHTLKYSLGMNNVTKPILLDGTINVIDYDRHDIGTLFGKPPANSPVLLDNTGINAKLQDGIRDITQELMNVDDKNKQIEFTLSMENVLVETNLATAVMSTRVEMLAACPTVPMVYRALAHVYTPVLGRTAEDELIRSFGTSNTYLELREKLGAAGEVAEVELITTVNNRMTEHMNHILHKRLSILPENMTVVDFVLDLDELMESLKDNYGDTVVKAFLKDQRKNIASLFRSINPDSADDRQLAESLTSDILLADWEGRSDVPKFTFIGMTYSLTLLNVISHDLQIAGLPDIGNGLSSKYQPVLYNLAKSIFAADDAVGNVARHLVVTKDGRVLEVTRGDLANDWYLVSLVK